MTTEVLIGRCVTGDESAWKDLHAKYIHLLTHMLGQWWIDEDRRDEMQDVIQDVFVRLIEDDYRALRAFDPARASFDTYLVTILQSAFADFGRSLSRYGAGSITGGGPSGADQPMRIHDDPGIDDMDGQDYAEFYEEYAV